MVNPPDSLQPMSEVLIVEPDPRGHRLYYVRILVDAFLAQGRSVVVLTTTTTLRSSEWNTHLAGATPRLEVRVTTDFTLPALAQAANETGADLTVLPDGDGYLVSALRQGWRGTGKLSLLVLRADGQPRKAGLRHARGAAKKTLAWLAGLRPRVRVSALRSPLVERRGPLRWAPDPITVNCSEVDVREIREQLDSYGDRYWIGIFGFVTARKNLPLIVEAIMGEPDIGLLVAGSFDADVARAAGPLLAEFTRTGGVVHHMPAPLNDAEFDGAIRAVDCVVAAYSNEGPSGVILKAAAAGTRLILAGAMSLKRDAMSLGESATWSKLDSEQIRQAIQRAKRLPRPNKVISPGTEAFVAALGD